MSTSESMSESGAVESTPGAREDTPAPADTAPAAPTGPLCEDHIREALKEVIDPELFVNIIDLGLVYSVAFEEVEGDKSDIQIEMTLTSPACPAGPQIIGQSKQVVSRLDAVNDVEIKLVMDPPWTPDRMTEDARDKLGIF